MSVGTPAQSAAAGAPTPAQALANLDAAMAAGPVEIAGVMALSGAAVSTDITREELQAVADDALDDDLLWAIFILL